MSLVRRPANATYMALKAVMRPKIPPTLWVVALPVNSPAASSQKVISRKKKTPASATEDRSEASRKMKVMIAHEVR